MPTPPIVIPGLRVIDVRREFQGGFTKARTATTHLINHHAADHYKQTNGLDDVRAIARWHTGKPPNGNGWPAIGYQLVLAEITEGGEIVCYQVSDLDTQRAHVWGLNHTMLGVCSAEDFTKVIPAPKWIEAQARTFAALLGIYPHAKIAGHKDVALAGHGTRCPGDRWAEWKPTLLNRIQALRSAPPRPSVTRYQFLVAQAAFTDRRPDARLADGPTVFQAGDIVEIGDITAGWGWVTSGIGFVPMATLRGPL